MNEMKKTVEDTRRRMDMMDKRLDDIDSMVTALVERVMNQPASIVLRCPHCGKRIDISMVGNHRATK